MTQQSHSQAYTLRKPKLKNTQVPQSSLQHYLQQLGYGNNLDVHRQMNGKRSCGTPYAMEYYSAIKRNTFESVLMMQMKLEPIIQTRVSRKEKNEYYILTQLCGIRKMVLIKLSAGQQQRHRHREQTYGHGSREEGEDGMYGECNMETYFIVYKIDS